MTALSSKQPKQCEQYTSLLTFLRLSLIFVRQAAQLSEPQTISEFTQHQHITETYTEIK